MTSQNELSQLNGWALVLGASSGFGEAISLALARAGMNIAGVHLDRRATMANVARIQERIQEGGREAWFFNVNAADEEKRKATLDEIRSRFESRNEDERVRVLVHSLAFGTLKPYWNQSDEATAITSSNMNMTLDVMAHSLVYWTQDALRRGLFGTHGRIFAMTSAGSNHVWAGYGAVSAAKAALEAHVRQLAVELAPLGITANAICAGVTDTPALRKIPGSDRMIEMTKERNPHRRLTTPEDVARAITALSIPATYWMTGNVIRVDGGEEIVG